MIPRGYRSDIDGLRAVAVIPVVLFHLSTPGFDGGFVGVDVFFVISGFLITSIILKEIQEGHFSFARFYERRIRRIFPALFFVIIATAISAYLILLPEDLLSFSQSMISATIFGANILLWNQSGYFDGPATMKPLLHTWSLSVEEQFYIVFPVLILLLTKYFPRHFQVWLVILLLLSFLASAIYVYDNQMSVFYLPTFRAWELLLGSVLALNIVPCPSTHQWRQLLSVAGLALIIYSVIYLSSDTIFPGANALYPCLGAALIIYAGSGGHASMVGSLLGWRPIVLIGLISYSLYLWHWPLIVFTKYYLLTDLALVEQASILVASIVLALFTWRFVERPFRGKSGLLERHALFALSALFMTLLVAAGLAGYYTNGFPQRLPPDVLKLTKLLEKSGSIRQISDSSFDGDDSRIYVLGDVNAESPGFLVWGDSHAKALAPAFDDVAKQQGKSGWLIVNNGCPALLEFERKRQRGCADKNSAVTQFISRHESIHTVFLVSRWGLYANNRWFGHEGRMQKKISHSEMLKNIEAFHNGLDKTLLFLSRRNIKIIFIEDVPEIGWDVKSNLLASKWFARDLPYTPPTIADYRTRQQPVADILQNLKLDYQFQVIDVAPIFCPNINCFVEVDGYALYTDTNHLSLYGALFVSSLFKGIL